MYQVALLWTSLLSIWVGGQLPIKCTINTMHKLSGWVDVSCQYDIQDLWIMLVYAKQNGTLKIITICNIVINELNNWLEYG